MTLGQKQELFSHLFAKLVLFAIESGYTVRMGETRRSNEQAEINAMGAEGRARFCNYIEGLFPALAAKIRDNTGSGIVGSVHELGLAGDLNLFKNGVYLTRTEDHAELGAWWKAQHPLCRWGGDFRDGNHYSLEHDGRK